MAVRRVPPYDHAAAFALSGADRVRTTNTRIEPLF
jgi:hypothetical protein